MVGGIRHVKNLVAIMMDSRLEWRPSKKRRRHKEVSLCPSFDEDRSVWQFLDARRVCRRAILRARIELLHSDGGLPRVGAWRSAIPMTEASGPDSFRGYVDVK
jgi:hypothetical protein